MAKTFVFYPDGRPLNQYDWLLEQTQWPLNYPVYVKDSKNWEDGWYHCQSYPGFNHIDSMELHEVPKEAKVYLLLLT